MLQMLCVSTPKTSVTVVYRCQRGLIRYTLCVTVSFTVASQLLPYQQNNNSEMQVDIRPCSRLLYRLGDAVCVESHVTPQFLYPAIPLP